MPSKATVFCFDNTIQKLRTTAIGKDVATYRPLCDSVSYGLGYSASDVDIEADGDAARPELKVNAPVSFLETDATTVKQPWIVLEAIADPGLFKSSVARGWK